MLGLHWLDWLTIGVYFALTVALGLRAARGMASGSEYFMGGRRFGRAYMIAHALGTGTSAEQPVVVAGAAYQIGLAGIWYQWLYLFATPFYWLLAPIYRRLRYVTMGDFFERRYGPRMGLAYTLLGLFNFTVGIALMLKGTALTIEAVSGGAMPYTFTVLVITALFVSYAFAGGLVAAISNDMLQGPLIVLMSVLLLPFAIFALGGWDQVQLRVPDGMWSLVAPTEVTLFFVVMIVINALVGIVVEPHHMAVCGAARSELASRTGWTYGNFIKRFLTLAWALTGVLAAALYPGLEQREHAFGVLVQDLLPAGLVGLMVACMLAAVISTCDAFMIGAGALYTRNIHPKIGGRDLGSGGQLWIGRASSLVVVGLGVVLALTLPSMIAGLKLLWTTAAAFGIAFWAAIVWRGANAHGMAASLVATLGTMVVTGPYGLDWDLASQIALYLPLGLITLVIGSLVRPTPETRERAEFYTLLSTPVGRESELRDAGVVMIDAGDIDHPDLAGARSRGTWQGLVLTELLHPSRWSWSRYRVDLLGFGAAWLLALSVLGLGFLLAWIGRGG
jgi:Na+/proline symporter